MNKQETTQIDLLAQSINRFIDASNNRIDEFGKKIVALERGYEPVSLEKQASDVINQSIHSALEAVLSRYDSPITKIANRVIENRSSEIAKSLDEMLCKHIQSDEFKNSLRDFYLHKMTRILYSTLEGTCDKAFKTMMENEFFRSQISVEFANVVKKFLQEHG